MTAPGPYVAVSVDMPDHPKIEYLSDKAFRLVIRAWCYSRKHLTDGRIDGRKWNTLAPPKVRRELIDEGIVEEQANGSVQLHGFLDWQQSRAQIDEKRGEQSRGATTTNHQRWHVARNVIDPDCTLCPSSTEPPTDETADPTSDRFTDRSTDRSEVGSGVQRRGATRETPATTSPQVTPATGGGGTDLPIDQLITDLAARGIRAGRLTDHQRALTTEMLATHGRDALIAEATAGRPPAVIAGALVRWLDMPEPPPVREVIRCPEHEINHHGTCPGCIADRLRGETA